MTTKSGLQRRQQRQTLFAQGGQIATNARKSLSSNQAAEAAGDFLLHLDHAQISLGQIIVKIHPQILQEGEDSFLLGAQAIAAPRPNFLWISIEDTSPKLGCYGDQYAVTPNLDRLASQGCRYTNCFTHAGVCAPSRSGIITGMYPTSMGTQFMRCKGVPPTGVKCFTVYLRAVGYYCTNDNKTDYNFDAPLTAWDESRAGARWRTRPTKETPFFSVILPRKRMRGPS